MSVHFSRYLLNTYSANPFFKAHIPEDYPIGMVCIKSRAFRRLPKNVQKLAALAKQYSVRTNHQYPAGIEGIEQWYDEEGYELKPETAERLSDEEIDASWPEPDEELKKFKAEDIPTPDSGFADPDSWTEPAPDTEDDEDEWGMTEQQVLRDIKSHGRGYAARYYGIASEQAGDDRALARAIMEKQRSRRKPPVLPLEKDPDSGPANAP